MIIRADGTTDDYGAAVQRAPRWWAVGAAVRSVGMAGGALLCCTVAMRAAGT